MLGNIILDVKSNGVVSAKQVTNTRTAYEHQKEAMKNLDIILCFRRQKVITDCFAAFKLPQSCLAFLNSGAPS